MRNGDGQLVTLARIVSTEDEQELVYVGLRDAFNKMIVPGVWQTYSGHIIKGSKSGKQSNTLHLAVATARGREGGGGGGGEGGGGNGEKALQQDELLCLVFVCVQGRGGGGGKIDRF